MGKHFVLVLVLAALVQSACTSKTPAGKAPAEEVDTAAIRKASQDRLVALSSGNIQGYLAPYAEDAVWMPPDAEDVVGKAVAALRLQATQELRTFRCTLETVEQEVLSPDWVLERGKYSVVRIPKAGGPSSVEVGTYLTVWKRQADQSFKIAYDIWHSDRPPGAEK